MSNYINKIALAILGAFVCVQNSVYAAADADLVTSVGAMTTSVTDNVPAIRTGLVTIMGIFLILALFVMGYRRVKGMVK